MTLRVEIRTGIDAPLNVTLNYLLIKDYVMAAKLICLTEYRRRKQEEQKSKSANEPDTSKLDDVLGMALWGWPFPIPEPTQAMIVDITEPTDSDGE